MEFRICFTIAKYKDDIFSLCKTSNQLTHRRNSDTKTRQPDNRNKTTAWNGQ